MKWMRAASVISVGTNVQASLYTSGGTVLVIVTNSCISPKVDPQQQSCNYHL